MTGYKCLAERVTNGGRGSRCQGSMITSTIVLGTASWPVLICTVCGRFALPEPVA